MHGFVGTSLVIPHISLGLLTAQKPRCTPTTLHRFPAQQSTEERKGCFPTTSTAAFIYVSLEVDTGHLPKKSNISLCGSAPEPVRAIMYYGAYVLCFFFSKMTKSDPGLWDSVRMLNHGSLALNWWDLKDTCMPGMPELLDSPLGPWKQTQKKMAGYPAESDPLGPPQLCCVLFGVCLFGLFVFRPGAITM